MNADRRGAINRPQASICASIRQPAITKTLGVFHTLSRLGPMSE